MSWIASSNRVRVIKDGIIRTIAGGGTANPGDGGLATNVDLAPTAVALFGSKLYIVEQLLHRVREVDLNTRLIQTIAGTGLAGFTGDTGAATLARLFSPTSIAVDQNGVIYVADRDNQRVRKISNGQIDTFAGTGVDGIGGDGGAAAEAQLSFPQAVRVSNNRLLIGSGNRVRSVDLSNNIISTIAGGGLFAEAGAPVTGTVAAIGVDAGNVLHFADLSPSGTFGLTSIACGAGRADPSRNSLAVSGALPRKANQRPAHQSRRSTVSPLIRRATLFFSDTENGRIRRLGLAQTCSFLLSKPGASIGAGGDLVSFNLTASAPDCIWTSTSNFSWLRPTSPSPWAGSAPVRFTVDANSGASRGANLTVAGLPFQVSQSEGGCTFSMTPQTNTVSAGGAVAPFQVTVTGVNCSWVPVVSPSFLSLPSGTVTRQGSANLEYVAAPNAGADPRTGSISAGGQNLLVIQRGSGTPQLFTDVPQAHQFFEYITLLRNTSVTLGCGMSVFCPEDGTTRGQMAAFIVRAIYGEHFAHPSMPYFTDVPLEHPFFKYVQKLRETGITSGCGTAIYCPNDPVTRGQMAAFLVRGRLGLRAGQTFPFPATPFFTDVPDITSVFQLHPEAERDWRHGRMRRCGVLSGGHNNARADGGVSHSQFLYAVMFFLSPRCFSRTFSRFSIATASPVTQRVRPHPCLLPRGMKSAPGRRRFAKPSYNAVCPRGPLPLTRFLLQMIRA